MRPPATTTMGHGPTPSSSPVGRANIATPTPNQPICVNEMRADGR